MVLGCGQEDVGAAVVAGGDAAPVFEAGEGVFDLMSLFVEGFIIGKGPFAPSRGRDAGTKHLVERSIGRLVD